VSASHKEVIIFATGLVSAAAGICLLVSARFINAMGVDVAGIALATIGSLAVALALLRGEDRGG
jgi:hypothetical protein